MTPEARRDGIVEIVNRDGKASVEALADNLDASRETIRRDLTELDRQGLLRKVHGGATAAEPSGFEKAEGALAARMTQNLSRKRAIARKAAGLLKPGDSLFIDTGSTTLIFAEELPQIAGLTVITNSAAIAALAIKGEDSRVFLIGGEYRRGGQESVGDMAVRQIGEFRAAYAFLTVAAFGAGGFMDHDLRQAQVARAMARQAAQPVVLADSSKMDRLGVFEVAPAAAPASLVTDMISPALAANLSERGVTVLLSDT